MHGKCCSSRQAICFSAALWRKAAVKIVEAAKQLIWQKADEVRQEAAAILSQTR